MQRASSDSVGFAQHLAARTQHDGQIFRLDMKFFDQRAGAGIGLGVEPLMRVAVARKKPFQPQHVRVAFAPDDHGAARAGFQQTHAAQDKRAHDPLAQIGIFHQNIAQPAEGMTSASTSSTACASTSEGLLDNCASSPMNWPGPWVTMTCGSPICPRWVISTCPEWMTKRPGEISPVDTIRSPVL